MAGTEVTDLLLRIRGETGDAEQAVGRVGKSFTELNSATELVQKAFGTLQSAAQAFVAVIDRGQGVSELTASFNALQQQAGSLASRELQQLREATQGLLSDTDLMRAANESLLAGLDPQQFVEVAKAADTLGDAVGKSTKTALDDLTRALDTGQTKLLKQYGVLVDTKKAEDDFAKSLGITTDKLSEEGKRYADRQAILDKVKQKTDALAQSNDGLGNQTLLVGDSFQKLQTAAGNVLDRFAKAVNENQDLAKAIDDLAKSIASIDIQHILDAANALARMATAGLNAIRDAGEVIKGIGDITDSVFKFSNTEKLKALNEQIAKQYEIIERAKNSAYGGSDPANNALLKRELAVLDDKLKQQSELWKEVSTSAKTSGDVQSETALKVAGVLDKVDKGYIDKAKIEEEARKKAEEAAKKHREEEERLNQTIEKQVSQFEQLNRAIEANSLEKSLDDAIKKLDSASFDSLAQKYKDALTEAARSAFENANKEAIAAGRITAEQIDAVVASQVGPKLQEKAQEFETKMNESFQNSVSFFSDLFNSAIDGSAQSFEDIFKDVIKRIAVGFAAQMAASLAGSLGLSGVANLGSAQGLGQAIASTVGFTGGGVAPFSSLLGGAAGAGGFSFLPSLFGGGATAGGITGSIGGVGGGFAGITAGGGVGGTAALGSSSLLSTFGPFGAGAAVLGGSILGGSLLASGIGSKDPFSGGLGGGLLGGSLLGGLGASVLGPLGALASFGGLFGGDSQKAQERQDREDLLNKLKDQFGSLSFGTVGGTGTLDAKNFNVGSGPLSGQGASFGNTFAQLLTGGDGKLSSDLAAIFENAVDGAKNFNEQLVNVQSAFDKFGLDANKAKGDIQNLFLDGKISAAEFGASLENLNKIQQHVFTGPSGIQDGIDIISSSLQDSPRVALEALADEFNTLAQAGYQSTTDIAGYFTNNMQPELAAVFQKLGDLGVKSFDDVAGAIAQNPDLVFAIISAIQSLNKEISAADSNTQRFAKTASNSDADTGKVFRKAASDAKDYNDEVDRAISKTKTLSDLVSGGNRGGDSGTSQKLNTTPP